MVDRLKSESGFVLNNDTLRSGFQIYFKNGFGISVQFGKFHHCANKETYSPFNINSKVKDHIESPDAEVAVLYNGSLLKAATSDQVIGYASPALVGELISIIKDFKGSSQELEIILQEKTHEHY